MIDPRKARSTLLPVPEARLRGHRYFLPVRVNQTHEAAHQHPIRISAAVVPSTTPMGELRLPLASMILEHSHSPTAAAQVASAMSVPDQERTAAANAAPETFIGTRYSCAASW